MGDGGSGVLRGHVGSTGEIPRRRGLVLLRRRSWRHAVFVAQQITKDNVGKLKEVWRFETPDGGRLQTTPLIVDGTMYVVTPRQKVVALDAATGKQKWIFDSGAATTAASRGLTWWTDGKESRLFTAAGSFIYAVNPATGTAITTLATRAALISARTFVARRKTIRITRPHRPWSTRTC